MTIDRANLNTPNLAGRKFNSFIHWDSDTTAVPLPINVQGVLALTSTDPEVGGFQCVPDLFRNFEQWVAKQPQGRDPFHPDLTGLEVKFVPMQAGDLLIFNTLLAHGIRPNQTTDRVRMAQYISMYPAEERKPGETRYSHPLLERARASERLRVSGRSSGMGEKSISTRRTQFARSPAARGRAMEFINDKRQASVLSPRRLASLFRQPSDGVDLDLDSAP